MIESNYLLENRHEQAGLRLKALSALFDETSFQHMLRLGLASSWHCWEVGAGGASVPMRLGREVGPDGLVIATDIDVRWAKASSQANVRVIGHDVVHDLSPEGPFDLIHARLVLVHIPEREAVLRKLAGALRPGGWLLIEDADTALQPLACIDETGPEQILANRIRRGFRQLMKDRGVDLAWGRTLPRLLREAGLQNVMADVFFPLARPECNDLDRGTILLLQEQLIQRGIASHEEIQATLDNLATGRIEVTTTPLVSAWGQKAV